jgi:MOSC domain-containing protein YiiM
VAAVNVSARKGEKKVPVPSVRLVEGHGIEGDAHGGTSGHRQVSLLADESVARMRAKGLVVGPGAFAENLTVEGIDLAPAHVGRRLRVGETILEVTQVGKECHDRCAIYVQVGDCVMPREGIFARVVTGGTVSPGDAVELLPPEGSEGPGPRP